MNMSGRTGNVFAFYSSNFDVICPTETWLSESVLTDFDQEIPTNYSIYCCTVKIVRDMKVEC